LSPGSGENGKGTLATSEDDASDEEDEEDEDEEDDEDEDAKEDEVARKGFEAALFLL
jgi:hypothetical protein